MIFGKLAKGALVAQVRYGAVAHARATKRGDAWWFDVRIGKKRMVTCDCGGAVQDRPSALTYEDAWGGCSHIIALYKGNVTQDVHGEVAGDYRLTGYRNFNASSMPIIFFTRLTQLGEKMFFWRWTARLLS